ncbi:efflux RND transporter periplasmic adaptor subunit, partial [Mesorhizobium sp.]|uniref:efflux RND transporter periplasmic adaptor subunit n=1 Tax=Mesorhizobium sp. TaxID=1871066 RepID=UPI0025D4613A
MAEFFISSLIGQAPVLFNAVEASSGLISRFPQVGTRGQSIGPARPILTSPVMRAAETVSFSRRSIILAFVRDMPPPALRGTMSRNATLSALPSSPPRPLPRPNLLLLLTCAAVTLSAAGCQKQQAAEKKLPVMVTTQTVALADYAPRTSLTGVIAARTLNNLSFRVGGRVAERLVDVGQHVDQG